MVEGSQCVSQNAAEINMLNEKLGYDAVAQLQHQKQQDAQANSRAWDAFSLSVAQDAQKVKHLSEIALLTSQQTGETENQQTVSPVRTATGDAIVGGVGVSAEQVAANVADLATSLIPVIATALATALGQTVAALVPVVVNASGGASTPSQTTPKS